MNRPVPYTLQPAAAAADGLGLRVDLAVAPVKGEARAALARGVEKADPPPELRRPPLSPTPS